MGKNAFGTVFCVFALGFAAFTYFIGTETVDRVRALAPSSATALLDTPHGRTVLIEARIGADNPKRHGNFVAYAVYQQRTRQRTSSATRNFRTETYWELTRTDSPPLWLDLNDGRVRIANEKYGVQKGGTSHESGSTKYTGFEAGQAVMAVGALRATQPEIRIDAEFLYAGTRDTYLADKRGINVFMYAGSALFFVIGLLLGGFGLRDRFRRPAAAALGATPGSPPSRDVRDFKDPLALTVEWTPARPFSLATRGRRQVVEPEPGRIELRAGPGALLTAAVFLVPGLALLGVAATLAAGPHDADPAFAGMVMSGFFGSIASLLGGGMLLATLPAHVFDRRVGLYWQGSRPPAAPDDRHSCRLQAIHAVQLLRVRFGRNRGMAQTYNHDLNLVLKDGARIAVVSIRDVDNARACASRIATLVGGKVWDATDPAFRRPVAAWTLQKYVKPLAIGIAVVTVLALVPQVLLGVKQWRSTDDLEREEQARIEANTRERAARNTERRAAAERAAAARQAAPAPAAAPAVFAPPPAPSAAPPDAGKNLLDDPSFERADPRQSAGGWRFEGLAAATGDWTTAQHLTGGRALQLRGAATGGKAPVWRSETRYRLVPNTLHVFRVAARGEGAARAAVGAKYYDDAGKFVGGHTCFCLDVPADDWYSLQVTVFARYPGATSVSLELQQCASGAAAGATPPSVYFDDAYFAPVAAAGNSCPMQAPLATAAAP